MLLPVILAGKAFSKNIARANKAKSIINEAWEIDFCTAFTLTIDQPGVAQE